MQQRCVSCLTRRVKAIDIGKRAGDATLEAGTGIPYRQDALACNGTVFLRLAHATRPR